jgi:hypothetical protein
MSCPANSYHGFVKFNIAPTDIQYSTINPSPSGSAAPFTLNYQPRSSPVQFADTTTNYIQEDSQNTLMYNGVRYTISSVQLCNATNYINPGAQHTLVFTFKSQYMSLAEAKANEAVNNNTNIPSSAQSTPLTIIFIIPIYKTTNTPNNDAYLKQLIHSDATTAVYPSMETLLKNQMSIRYGACFDANLKSNAFGITASIYNFIPGITITEANWISIIGSRLIGDYVFDSTKTFVTSYKTGLPEYNTASSVLPSLPKSPTDGDFTINFTLYTKDISAPAKRIQLTPDQYECRPFNQLNNLELKDGVQKVSLDKVIATDNTANSLPNTMTVWQAVAIFLIIVVVLAIIIAFLLWRNSIGQTIPTPGAAPVATGAAP